LKITLVWLGSESRFVRFQDLTPEEILLRSIEAPDYGADVESTWEACWRKELAETMKRRMLEQENDYDEPGDREEES